MCTNSLADWVTAIAAVVYTGGTFALWWTTKKSLDTARDGFKLNFLLAYVESGAGQGVIGRILAQSDKVKAHALERLLKSVFRKDYEELKAALREKPEPTPPLDTGNRGGDR